MSDPDATLTSKTTPWKNGKKPVEVHAPYKFLVDVYTDAYIPNLLDQPRGLLTSPISSDEFFGTDNRISPKKGASARIYTSTIIDIGAKSPEVTDIRGQVGATFHYYPTWLGSSLDPDKSIADKKKWRRRCAVGEFSPIGEVRRIDSHTVRVMVQCSAKNPLSQMLGIRVGPAIDCTFYLTLKRVALDAFTCDLVGVHDGFPNYSVFVGKRLVYHHNVLLKGEKPTALFSNPIAPIPGEILAQAKAEDVGQIHQKEAYDPQWPPFGALTCTQGSDIPLSDDWQHLHK